MNLHAGKMVQKYNHVRSKKLRDSAKGAPCMINSPVCNNDLSTSVLCHLDSLYHGKSTSIKADDSAAAIGCYPCHHWLSLETGVSHEKRYKYHTQGVFRTIKYWFDLGILKVKAVNRDILKMEWVDERFHDDISIKQFSDWIREGVIKIA